jgi:signal transduction histidine kinase
LENKDDQDNEMTTIASARLTYPSVRRLDRGKYLALAAVVFLTLTGLLGLLFHVAEPTYPDLVSNILYPLTSFVGASWALTTAYRAYRGPVRLGSRYALAWLLVGTGLLANSLGGLYFTYLERSGQTILVPSLSDVGFTLFYPLIFVGLFLMPTLLQFRLRAALDALITTLCVLGVSWFFFISKVFGAQLAAQVSIPELVTVVSYPFWDMLLLLALMLLIYRRANALFLPSLVLFGTGMLANIWADTGYAYTVAVGTYESINFLIDPFWYLGFLLVGLSGLYQYAAIARGASHEGSSLAQLSNQAAPGPSGPGDAGIGRWRLMQHTLIYLPLAILLALTIYNEFLESVYHQKSSLFLIVLAALVGLLVAFRSLVATRENERLLNALAVAKAEQEAIATEQARLYAGLRLVHERLKELDKLKDQFMITASHELRTPLTSIGGYLDLLVEHAHQLTPEQQREFLLKAQRSSEELVLLLSNVMDASRLEVDAGIRSAHLQSVEVREAIQGIVDLIEPQVTHEQRKVELCIPPSLAVQADPVRLRQVLLNVSVNAMKYSLPGSPIIFSARASSDPVPSVIISVIDKGNGIAPRDQDRLFQRFVRLERDLNSSIRGSGLGLYISRRLVEAMGGKIWVESRGIPGEGSSFNIQLLIPR